MVANDRLIRTANGWAEPAPTHCPNGHDLGPGRVLVGSQVCSCEIHHHRTHTCIQCGSVVYTPPMTAQCTDGSFDGRAGS
jgi:hypothetical protein